MVHTVLTEVGQALKRPLWGLVALLGRILMFKKVSSTEKELVIVPGSHIALAIGQQGVRNLWPRELDWLARHSRV